MSLLQSRSPDRTLRSNAAVNFVTMPLGVGAQKINSGLARVLARLMQALHESRQINAAREIARHRHLIARHTNERF